MKSPAQSVTQLHCDISVPNSKPPPDPTTVTTFHSRMPKMPMTHLQKPPQTHVLGDSSMPCHTQMTATASSTTPPLLPETLGDDHGAE